MLALLENYFRASYPAVAIQTTDEKRAIEIVTAAVRKIADRGIATWSATEGMVVYDLKANTKRTLSKADDPLMACALKLENMVIVLRDIHLYPMDRTPVLLRAFRDFCANAPERGSTVVIMGNGYKPHPSMEKLVTVVQHRLPTPAELEAIAREAAAEHRVKPPSAAVVQALYGLTGSEAENALALSVVERGTFDAGVIYREKTQAIEKGGLLEIIDADPDGMKGVGGLDVLKEWVRRRKRVWSPEAVKFGLQSPRGLMILGVQGSGKSLAAKAIGAELGLPTIRIDCGKMFGMYVGESERVTREILDTIDAFGPVVAWIDEIDKAGMSGKGGDGGASSRVFGTFITWMQERRGGAFLVATGNNVDQIPPEMMRKGRFDEIFTVDLPAMMERGDIFQIHLRKRKRSIERFHTPDLIEATVGFTGAEIEAAIDDGMFRAFDAGRELETSHIVEAARDTQPLSVTAAEQIEAIRAWGRSHGKRASSATED